MGLGLVLRSSLEESVCFAPICYQSFDHSPFEVFMHRNGSITSLWVSLDSYIMTKSIVSLMAPPQAESSIVVPLYARHWSYVSHVLRDASHREFSLCLNGETFLRVCSAENVEGTHSLFERHSTQWMRQPEVL